MLFARIFQRFSTLPFFSAQVTSEHHPLYKSVHCLLLLFGAFSVESLAGENDLNQLIKKLVASALALCEAGTYRIRGGRSIHQAIASLSFQSVNLSVNGQLQKKYSKVMTLIWCFSQSRTICIVKNFLVLINYLHFFYRFILKPRRSKFFVRYCLQNCCES